VNNAVATTLRASSSVNASRLFAEAIQNSS